MCINVACCADIAVTQPLLNLLQAHAIGIEQTGADRESGYVSSGVQPENPGNAGSGNRAESVFPSGLHRYSQDNRCSSFCRRPVCVGKEMRNIVLHDSNHRPSGRAVKRRDD